MRIEWKPFMIESSLVPGQAVDKLERYKMKFGPGIERMIRDPNNALNTRAKQIHAELKKIGKESDPEFAGLEFRYHEGSKVFSDIYCHLLMAHPAVQETGLGDKVMAVMFRHYFSEGKKIDTAEEITAVAKEAGLSDEVIADVLKEMAHPTERTAAVKKEIASYSRGGINGVPHLIFPNGQQVSGAQEADTFEALLKSCVTK